MSDSSAIAVPGSSLVDATDPKKGPQQIIEPNSGSMGDWLREAWRYRELLLFLVWRDIKVRYKQTALGVAWAVLQPAMTMAIFTVVFGKLAKVPSDGVPYPLFSLAGLVPWTFFAVGLAQSSNSLVGNANLIRKVYFPRVTSPVATVMAGGVDFFVAFAVLLVVMAGFGVVPGGRVIFLPLFLLLAAVTSIGVGLWLSALNVKYRDVKYTVPFISQFWLYATPVGYPSSLLPEPWRTLSGLNPMAGVVEGFRWALLDVGTAPGPLIWVSAATSVAITIGGIVFFKRMEESFADIV